MCNSSMQSPRALPFGQCESFRQNWGVGFVVGTGTGVGLAVGVAVGLSVGAAVGAKEKPTDFGEAVGLTSGCGAAVGCAVGAASVALGAVVTLAASVELVSELSQLVVDDFSSLIPP
jgi:hypothetical protein